MEERMIEVSRDHFALYTVGLRTHPTMAESMSVMQFVIGGELAAQAIYRSGVKPKYQVSRAYLASLIPDRYSYTFLQEMPADWVARYALPGVRLRLANELTAASLMLERDPNSDEAREEYNFVIEGLTQLGNIEKRITRPK